MIFKTTFVLSQDVVMSLLWQYGKELQVMTNVYYLVWSLGQNYFVKVLLLTL